MYIYHLAQILYSFARNHKISKPTPNIRQVFTKNRTFKAANTSFETKGNLSNTERPSDSESFTH